MKDRFFFPGFFTSFHIHSVLYTEVRKGWAYPNHKHPLFEILYCESGTMSEWVNGVEYMIQAGDLILINSGEQHSLQAHEVSRLFNFHFDLEPREVHSIFHRLRRPIVSAEQPPEIRSEIQYWINVLIGLFQEEGEMDFTQKIILQSVMLQFLAFVLEKIVVSHVESDSHASVSKRQIATEVAYLLETWGGEEKVRIIELSARLNVHRNYITNCFKEVYGVSPKYYLTKVRIEKAKKLLQETTMSVQVIADELSFSSSAYFCKFFRSHVGISPFKYRSGAER